MGLGKDSPIPKPPVERVIHVWKYFLSNKDFYEAKAATVTSEQYTALLHTVGLRATETINELEHYLKARNSERAIQQAQERRARRGLDASMSAMDINTPGGLFPCIASQVSL